MNTKITSSIFGVLFNYLLYAYITKLENIGCECADSHITKVIKSSILINYLLIFGSLFFEGIPSVTLILIFIYNVISTYTTFMFLHSLKNKKCKCSDSIIRDIYYYYYYINILIICVFICMVGLLLLMNSF